MNELERWANFYLLVAAAAATLIGLLFVVITLAAERRVSETSKIPIYLTPTVIYFASVLFLAALLCFPSQTRLTANFCICLMGVVGLVYLNPAVRFATNFGGRRPFEQRTANSRLAAFEQAISVHQ